LEFPFDRRPAREDAEVVPYAKDIIAELCDKRSVSRPPTTQAIEIRHVAFTMTVDE
jgi:hypothetical protein